MSVNLNDPVVVPGAGAGGPPAEQPDDQPALFKKAGGDWGKANDSYFSAVKELQRVQGIASNAEQLAEQNRQLQGALANLVGAGQPGGPVDLFAQIQTETGLPAEPFRNAVSSVSRATVMEELGKMFSPILSQMQADETLSAEIDNFDQLKGDARKFMRDNQEVADTFNAVRAANPIAAWKYAIREMAIAKGQKAPTPSPHASLPGGMTPQGRAPVNPAGPAQGTRESEALEYGKSYGDMAPYTHERLKGTSVERAIRDVMRQLGLPMPEA